MSSAPDHDDPPKETSTPDWEAVTAPVEWDQALPAGTRLRDYEVRSVIAEGAYGIVYLAWDDALRRRVALKEYLPRALAARSRVSTAIETRGHAGAAYATGLKAFVAEARLLARFDHPALAKVYRFWEENATAYMVMPLHEGPSLESALVKLGRTQDEGEVRAWLRPVLDAIAVMHAAHCYHHHIGPDNIVLTPAGPVLLGMSAARRLVVGLSDGPAATVKPGYAPIEQYSDAATRAPGPWTDLYALAAVAYRAVSGQLPTPAPERIPEDRLRPLAAIAAERCSASFVQTIDATLAVLPDHRPRNDAEFREMMGGIEAPLPALPMAAQRDLMAEPFVDDGSPREVTVPIPTQPYPPPAAVADDPMEQPFLTEPAATATPLPFERTRIELSRKLKIAIGAGVCVLGGIAAIVYVYAARAPATTLHAAGAASAASAAAAPRPVAALPAPAQPMLVVSPPAPAAPKALAQAPETPARTAAPPRSAPVEDAADRRTRCADLLQEATLRRLGAAEAAFFKKECR